MTGASKSTAEPLEVNAGFKWDGRESEGTSSGQSDDKDVESDGDEPSTSRRKANGFVEDRTGDMATDTPTSAAEFERLLLGSPDSSYLWIQYMSYHIQISEIDTARQVAQRALNTISFREEGEKLNVWIAILNLENAYGSEESLEETFKEAVQRNEPKAVYLKLADIYAQTGKYEVSLVIVLRCIRHELMGRYRKRKSCTSARSKSSRKAPKYGCYLGSTTSLGSNRPKLASSFLAV
jgi:rRNA biogenesis protein RRP5